MTKISKMMPVVALVMGAGLAFATSAFRSTSVHKIGDPLTTYNFEYTPPAMDPDPYSDANVKDTANWTYIATSAGCDDGTQAACSIEGVSASHVVLNPGQDPRLDPSVNIQTQEDGSTGNYLLSSADAVAIHNKSL